MNFQPGQIVRVSGKSQKGKARVQTWGDFWTVFRVQGSKIMITACSDQEDKPLPDSARWVDLPDDRDIKIQEIVN